MSTRRLALLLPAVALVGVLAVQPGCESAPVEGQQVGNLCPDIAGQDADGKVVRLSDYRGKAVLVNFWGTWCQPCRLLIPHERDMVERKYKDRPFVLLGVAQDSAADLKEFQKDFLMPWPNIVDGTRLIARQWKVDGVPSALLVNHRGVIRHRWLNGFDPDEVWAAVDAAVREAEKAP
jgi:peroxiredoxin